MAARQNKDGVPRGRARRAKLPTNPNKPMTPRQERFVQEHCLGHSATEAARRAGYSAKSAGKIGHDLVHAPEFLHVQNVIRRRQEERAARYEVTADRVMQFTAYLAFGDLRDVMTWGPNGLVLKSSEELTPEQAALIQGIQQADLDYGKSLKAKTYSRLEALALLSKCLGMQRDRVEHSGQVDFGAVKDSLARKLSPIEARAQEDLSGESD